MVLGWWRWQRAARNGYRVGRKYRAEPLTHKPYGCSSPIASAGFINRRRLGQPWPDPSRATTQKGVTCCQNSSSRPRGTPGAAALREDCPTDRVRCCDRRGNGFQAGASRGIRAGAWFPAAGSEDRGHPRGHGSGVGAFDAGHRRLGPAPGFGHRQGARGPNCAHVRHRHRRWAGGGAGGLLVPAPVAEETTAAGRGRPLSSKPTRAARTGSKDSTVADRATGWKPPVTVSRHSRATHDRLPRLLLAIGWHWLITLRPDPSLVRQPPGGGQQPIGASSPVMIRSSVSSE